MGDQLVYKVVISNGSDEVLARASKFELAKVAYAKAVEMLPRELVELRHGARIIERSDRVVPFKPRGA
jgi:hypothetical protein